MKWNARILCSPVMLGLLCQLLSLAAGPSDAKQSPKDSGGQTVESTNWQAQFQIEKGFRIELVASEQLAASPVAMAFDENGRLFVAEMRDYPDQRARTPHLGRIRILEDTDGDGQFDSSTVYAEEIPWPSALACYDGGVFVAATPDILYFKDTKGNGVSDVRRAVFTGVGGGTVPASADAVLNSFAWGSDNRIHCGTAGIGGVVQVLSASGGASLDLGDHDFSFDPRALTLFLDAGPAGSGVTFNNQGRKLVSSLDQPLQAAMYDPRYTRRNPFFPPPPELSEVVPAGARIFRFALSEQPASVGGETRKTNTPARAVASASGDKSTLLSTPFIEARSCVVYRGSAFPTAYAGNVFIADSGAHVIHRAILRQTDLGLAAERAPNEPRSEFLVSKDPLFKPFQIIAGPDGALYVADLREGGDSGRIYRIVPENFKQPKSPKLGKAKTRELVEMLAHPDGWHRDTAARLLYQWRDAAAGPLLASMLLNSASPVVRLNALNSLDGVGALNVTLLGKALQDSDAAVRARAVALSEKLTSAGTPGSAGVLAGNRDELWGQLKSLATDPSIAVRYQLAFTIGEIRQPDRIEALAQILRRDIGNSWIEAAVMSSVSEGAGELFSSLARDSEFRRSAAGIGFLQQLGAMIGVQGRTEEVAQAVNSISGDNLNQEEAFDLAYSLGKGLHWRRSSLKSADAQGKLQPIYNDALKLALNAQAPASLRIKAIRVMGGSPDAFSDISDVLPVFLSPTDPEAVQSATIAMLGHWPDAWAVTNLTSNLPGLTTAMRRQVASALLVRTDRLPAVLDALENGPLRPADFSSPQQDFLRTASRAGVRERALKLFGPARAERPAMIEQFQPGLRLKGAAAHGQELFQARCAACHEPASGARALGPSLARAAKRGKENLLRAIIEPNAAITPGYQTTVIETGNGESFVGIAANQNDVTVTLRQSSGDEIVLPRTNIRSLEAQPWSLMPEGLEEGMTQQDMADLLEHVTATP
jgi:putative membrane-bound dehydrogenase-like protein